MPTPSPVEPIPPEVAKDPEKLRNWVEARLRRLPSMPELPFPATSTEDNLPVLTDVVARTHQAGLDAPRSNMPVANAAITGQGGGKHPPEYPAAPAAHQAKPQPAHPAAHQEKPPSAHPAAHQEKPPSAHPTAHQEKPPSAHPAAHQEKPPSAYPTAHQEKPPSAHPAAHQEKPPSAYPTAHQEKPPSAHPSAHPPVFSETLQRELTQAILRRLNAELPALMEKAVKEDLPGILERISANKG